MSCKPEETKTKNKSERRPKNVHLLERIRYFWHRSVFNKIKKEEILINHNHYY